MLGASHASLGASTILAICFRFSEAGRPPANRKSPTCTDSRKVGTTKLTSNGRHRLFSPLNVSASLAPCENKGSIRQCPDIVGSSLYGGPTVAHRQVTRMHNRNRRRIFHDLASYRQQPFQNVIVSHARYEATSTAHSPDAAFDVCGSVCRISEQVCDWNVESVGKTLRDGDGRVALTPFDTADVGAIDVELERKPFLTHALCLAQAAHVTAKAYPHVHRPV